MQLQAPLLVALPVRPATVAVLPVRPPVPELEGALVEPLSALLPVPPDPPRLARPAVPARVVGIVGIVGIVDIVGIVAAVCGRPASGTAAQAVHSEYVPLVGELVSEPQALMPWPVPSAQIHGTRSPTVAHSSPV